MKKILSFLLCAAMLLALTPAAMAAEGLFAFPETKPYAETTFSDAAAGAWYAGSVKTVYGKGVMDGTGTGRFDPGGTVSWSQAVTIAARLYAAYHNQEISAAEGPWYAQYLEYARAHGLLPAGCPEDEAMDETPVTREELAALFRSVLEEEDLPAVNDQIIPDLDAVQESYRDAVSKMCAAGIFTGGEDGRFDPGGQATRAQVAAILARLLCPAQRVGHDARQNPYMAEQMGNFRNGGLCARLGETVYYVYMTPWEDGRGEYTQRWSIYARGDDGQVREVYTAGTDWVEFSLLSVGPDGLLYFVASPANAPYELRRLDPETGAVQTVYRAGNGQWIDIYLFYDDQLYLCESDFSHDGRIGRVENGRMTVLATLPDSSGLYVNDTLYAFGGELFYLYLAPIGSPADDQLMVLDLETGKTRAIPVKANEFAYQGGALWTTEYTDGNYPRILKRRSLAMPELEDTVRVLDGEFNTYYDNLYANGDQLYYQISQARKLWTVSPAGETKALAVTSTPYYEASAVTSQGIALLPLDILGLISFRDIDIVLPDGHRTNLPAFLGQPYFMEGSEGLAPTDDMVFWDLPPQRSELGVQWLRAYRTADGALALEAQIDNNGMGTCALSWASIQLGGAASLDTCLSLDDVKIPAGQSVTGTFVFPAGSVELTGALSELSVAHTVHYSVGD